MFKIVFAVAALLTSSAISTAYACELKLVGAAEFNKTCKVVVGFADGKKVGAFKDKNGTRAGTCPGFLHVTSMKGDTIVIDGRTRKLSQDCRTSN